MEAATLLLLRLQLRLLLKLLKLLKMQKLPLLMMILVLKLLQQLQLLKWLKLLQLLQLRLGHWMWRWQIQCGWNRPPCSAVPANCFGTEPHTNTGCRLTEAGGPAVGQQLPPNVHEAARPKLWSTSLHLLDYLIKRGEDFRLQRQDLNLLAASAPLGGVALERQPTRR